LDGGNMLELAGDTFHGILYNSSIDGVELRGFGGFRWTENGNDKMDLSGSNLGIATSTPSQKLDVRGNIFVENKNGIILQDTANSNYYLLQLTSGAIALTSHDCN
jgi:filamentous hemagglutinin family protein